MQNSHKNSETSLDRAGESQKGVDLREDRSIQMHQLGIPAARTGHLASKRQTFGWSKVSFGFKLNSFYQFQV